MPLFLWTPFSISFLVQLMFGAICCVYLLSRLSEDRRHGSIQTSTLALTLAAFNLTAFLAANFLRATLHPDYSVLVLPWVAPFGALAILSIIVFAYTYPAKLIRLKSFEGIAVTVLGLAYLGFELGVAIWRVERQMSGFVEYRGQLSDLAQLAVAAWLLIVLFRQFVRSARPVSGQELKVSSLLKLLLGGNITNSSAAGARAVLLVAVTPLLAVLFLTLRTASLINGVVSEIAHCWIMLAVLGGFSLVYLNYIPERSSFLTKIVGVTLTVILVILSSMSWIVGSVYAEAYTRDHYPKSGTAIRFQPQPENSYYVNNTAFRFDEDLGERFEAGFEKELSFPFPFYGLGRDKVFVDPIGIIGFDYPSSSRHLQDRFGGHGGIFALIVGKSTVRESEDRTLGQDRPSGLYFNQQETRVLLTWYRMQGYAGPAALFTIQVALYPNGVIEFFYDTIPESLKTDVFSPLSTPLHAGITPGWLTGSVQRVHFETEMPIQGLPTGGLVDDYRLDFLIYLNRVYAPVAAFSLLVIALTVVLIPLFFQRNLVRPLDRLLASIQSFRRGEDPGRVQIVYKDEIGFLTETFGNLVETQTELVRSLEEQVAARTQAAVSLAERNARLQERNHLSSELHDAVCQTLFSSSMIAESLSARTGQTDVELQASLKDIQDLNRAALAEMRSLLMELRPGRITQVEFGALLRDLVNSLTLEKQFNVEIILENDGRIPDDVQFTFLRVAQESLNNIIKHSRARNIKIVFDAMPRQAFISISDDGRGFDLQSTLLDQVGLKIMHERAQKVGADLSVMSTLGGGATVTLIWYGGECQ